jgi:hypothetical protein
MTPDVIIDACRTHTHRCRRCRVHLASATTYGLTVLIEHHRATVHPVLAIVAEGQPYAAAATARHALRGELR